MFAHGRWPDPRSGFLYIVLELVDGYTLARWVEQTHPTPHEVVVLFRKLFDALEHMHGRDVFHRDLSLRNIMVTQQGEPVIIDFGAADYTAAEDLTDGPLPPGTPRNRSPEAVRFWNENRLKPEARYTFKATDDIFALGADLYDVLTDPMPTRGEKRPPLGHEVMEPPTPFKATKGRVPVELSAYVMKLIRCEPEERPATAKDARGPLEEFAQCEGPEWRNTRVHSVAAQLPPEPAEAAPVPVEVPQVQLPFHPPALPLPAPPPVDVAPVPSALGAAALTRLRQAWRRPVFVGPLALGVLAAAVAVFVLHRPAQPEPSPVARSAPADQPPASPPSAEKPTSRPAQLPSPLPTQQEASPSVKQPDNSPTLTSGVPNPPLARPRRRLSKVQKCVLLVASIAWIEEGCAGVQTRPDPEDCPKEAVTAMRQELGWRLGGGTQPFILLDVTKGSVEEAREHLFTVWKDGPVTGELIEAEGKAPAGTRLEGHLWTTGDRIYGRYLRARLPGGHTVPICVELQSGGMFGADKREGSKPGHTVGSKVSGSVAVQRWR
jgi:serine/threonine protein kinase